MKSPIKDDDTPKSPFTGGPVEILSDEIKIKWRGEEFIVPRKYYHCIETGHDYTDAELEDETMWNVFKAYCKKHDINFFKLIPEGGIIPEGERWISVDEALPEMDREVFVLTDDLHGKKLSSAHFLCFGHIVNKEYCNDYNGWNIPGVGYWYPCPPVPGEDEDRYK